MASEPSASNLLSKKRTMSDSTNPSTSETKPSPFIFRLPDQQRPDVRLSVFDQEYHVHSMILKLHSTYFRKFLDSPDKSGSPPSPSVNFRYDYATAVDDDGMWALEPADKVQLIKPEALALLESGQKISVESEKTLFRKLMSAMYNRPYRINSAQEILDLTRIADFYCALPIVSVTLSGQLIHSDLFSRERSLERSSGMPGEAIQLIASARKLRHGTLFRECLVHIVGDLDHNRRQNNTHYEMLCQDVDLYHLAIKHHGFLCQKIMVAQTEQIKFIQSPHFTFELPYAIRKLLEGPDTSAEYYRELKTHLEKKGYIGIEDSLVEALNILLKNELVLDRSGSRTGDPGGPYDSTFLTCDVETVVLPWNEDEVDW